MALYWLIPLVFAAAGIYCLRRVYYRPDNWFGDYFTFVVGLLMICCAALAVLVGLVL